MDLLMATLLLCVPVVILLRTLTGVEALIFRWSSGIPRLVVGVCCALFVYITFAHCDTMVLRHPCAHEVPGGAFVLPRDVVRRIPDPIRRHTNSGVLLQQRPRGECYEATQERSRVPVVVTRVSTDSSPSLAMATTLT